MRHWLVAGLACLPFTMSAVAGEKHRQLGAHEHGHGNFNIAIEGQAQIELVQPGQELTLHLGADPNAPHPGALETTLHWAVKRGAPAPVVGWLLGAGADPMARTREGRAAILPILGWTPLDFALPGGYPVRTFDRLYDDDRSE